MPVVGITNEMYYNHYRQNPQKLIEYYCNVKLKWWQVMMVGLIKKGWNR